MAFRFPAISELARTSAKILMQNAREDLRFALETEAPFLEELGKKAVETSNRGFSHVVFPRRFPLVLEDWFQAQGFHVETSLENTELQWSHRTKLELQQQKETDRLQ